MEAQHQGQIVSQFLAAEGKGETATEKLKFPSLSKCFSLRGGTAPVSQESTALPLATDVKVTPVANIAEALTRIIVDYKPSKVLGLKWSAGSKTADVMISNSVTCTLNFSEDDLVHLVTMVLKARANLESFAWEFGNPHIDVTYRTAAS